MSNTLCENYHFLLVRCFHMQRHKLNDRVCVNKYWQHTAQLAGEHTQFVALGTKRRRAHACRNKKNSLFIYIYRYAEIYCCRCLHFCLRDSIGDQCVRIAHSAIFLLLSSLSLFLSHIVHRQCLWLHIIRLIYRQINIPLDFGFYSITTTIVFSNVVYKMHECTVLNVLLLDDFYSWCFDSFQFAFLRVLFTGF